jgi:cytoplasmic iron level regulating protein YaaA (DUF328/UPF0246 family)
VLGPAREQALLGLAALLGRPDAAARLLLPDAVRDAALLADSRVQDSSTLPALRRYAGVVYAGLGFDDLDPAEQRLAGRSCYVFSGLFGVVRGDEAIPDYRVPAKAVLPGVGTCATFWRRTLDQVFAPLLGRGLVVDLRSSDYAAMWRPDRLTAQRLVTVRVRSPTPSGRLAVVSYASKLAKGRLAAALVRSECAGDRIRTPEDVARAWTGRAEVTGNEVVLYTSG